MTDFKYFKGTAKSQIGVFHYNVWATVVIDNVEQLDQYLQLLGMSIKTKKEALEFASQFTTIDKFTNKASFKQFKNESIKIRIFIEATDGYAQFKGKETVLEFEV